MKKLIFYLLLLFASPAGLFSQTATVGTTGANYSTLKAAFDAINAGTLQGAITLQIIDNTTETSSASLNASGTGSANYASITIFPTSSGYTISGDLASPLINFNGADNITIDGRVNGSGITDLTINNSNTSNTSGTSTIRFINDATNNLVKYCNLKGSSTGTANGIILFSTTTGTTGNDNNTIDYNNITSSSDANRPINAIYSAGTVSHDNSGNIISNNNIFNVFNRGITSYGVNIAANNSAWSISGNSFFETNAFVPTGSVDYCVIRINSATGINFSVSSNYIGGNSALCGGSQWTKTNAFNNIFYGIYFSSGTGTASNVQNNTIKNINWSNSLNAYWIGILVSGGDVNVGTTTGNSIGDITGNGSILITSATTKNDIYGIDITGTGTVNCQNNKIGSITSANNATNASNIYGIYKSASAGTTIISNNTIGSTTTSNSIYTSSPSTIYSQNIFGVVNYGTGIVTISSNTIANMTNGSANTTSTTRGAIDGILSSNGTIIISDNEIYNLTNGNAYVYSTQYASVCGITLTGTSQKSVSGNKIYNLANTYASFNGSVIGIYIEGGSGNIISSNFIHDLSVQLNSSASIYGIKIASGTSTYSNNIITLGGNSTSTVFGIYETGSAGNYNNLYFNTVYIGGNPASGTDRSFALYSNNTDNTRDFRNNILVNARSTAGGSNLHYSLYINTAGGSITCDNNDYFVSGTGGTLGYYGSAKTSLPIVTGQDIVSLTIDPVFALPGGSTASDYIPSDNSLIAASGTGILTDYAGTTRSLTVPSMGAFEISIPTPVTKVEVYKTDILQASYSTLKEAFDAFNAGTHNTGAFEIRITGTTTETSSAILNASGMGSANYSSITIFPTVTGLTINGDLAAPLIDLNGADNVTIDGRVNGSDITDLTINNSNTSNTSGTSTIRFINDATNNVVKYCNIKGSSTGTTNGIVLLSTSTVSTGNDNNTIDNNNITNSADANRPINAIYSAGTVSRDNSGNIISNNNIFNVFNRGITSYGVNIAANNSAWSISGNSFFETIAFVPSSSVPYFPISINNSTGINFTISGNYIGGNSALCGGSPWTKTNTYNNIFCGIYLKTGTGTASNVQNNTIKNINWSNPFNANWIGILIDGGDVNIGTTTGNSIGDITGNGSILVTSTTTNNNVYGINITGTGTVNCQNNKIGSITTANASSNGSHICGIYKSASAGTTIISNNTIGSTTTSNSIYASSPSTGNIQNVRGIQNDGTGTVTISGNTIANMTNGSSNTITTTRGKNNGISSTDGTITISDNEIYNLINGNAYIYSNNYAPVCGISLTGGLQKTITGNKIYNLSDIYASFAGSVMGIYLEGGSGNIVSSNFIHDLSVQLNSSASIYGIKIASGTSTYANNIITLGGNSTSTLFGIYQTGSTGNDNNLYFNTVYIGGNPASGTDKSYALYSIGNSNIRDFRNNILVNTRSTIGGSNMHFALYLVHTGGTITCENNDYLVTGTGGTLGYYGGLKTSLPIVTGQDIVSLTIDPGFALPGGTTDSDYIPSDNSLLAAAGTGILTDYAGTTRSLTVPSMGAFEISIPTPVTKVEVYKTDILQASCSTLKEAFDAFNAGTHNTGAFEIRITGTTTETSSAILNASGMGSANYSSITIFPTVTGLTINGDLAAPLIDLNGADNVTIDGRVNATGSTISLSIDNSNTSSTIGTSTIRFVNDASNNVVKYCNLKGSSTGASNGIVLLSTTTGTTGNDNNTIDNNNITNSADANRPINGIYSAGTVSKDNSGNIVSNNNIFNVINCGITSYGINIAANSSAWTISGNSFFETASFIPTGSVDYYGIKINNTSGVNFSVSDNYIGGTSASCGGSPWSKTNAFNNIFYGISLSAGTGSASNIQNNTIRNISWSNSLNAYWIGILIAGGDVNVGTVTGNTIGNITGNSSILITSATTNNDVYGIYISTTGTVNCQNNKIGSITAANNSTNASNIYGIYKSASAGNTIISNNTIGSTTTANSIYASSQSTVYSQNVYGIYNIGTGNITVSSNTIANLTNGSANTTSTTRGAIDGILSSNGTITVSDNEIYSLKNGNAYVYATQYASVCGITLTGTSVKSMSGNKIYNLSNTYASFAGSVIGIYLEGGSGNIVSSNFIHDLSVQLNSSASIFGIRIASGTSTYANNIITLGGNITSTLFGIYQTGSAGNDNNLYFNTVYIGGNPASGSDKSFALYSIGNSNIRDFRNNILVNTRSTTGGSNLHFALYLVEPGGSITCDYNNYYVSGTGGTLGYYGTFKSSLPITDGQDNNSYAINPVFSNAGGSVDIDYKIAMDLIGIAGTGIVTDYNSDPRNNPTMGAWERVVNKWTGVNSTDYPNPANWTGNTLPLGNHPNIIFDDSPSNDCYLDTDRSFTNITINQSAYRLVTNGHKLTIEGNLIFTGGAQIDASSAGSIIEYKGTVAQSLEPGQFLNDKIYELIIDNAIGTTLNSDLTVDDAMTINSGRLFTISAMKLLKVSGVLTNNAGNTGLVIKSDQSGDGKLINETSNVPATVELYLTGGIISPTVGIYHYFVPPVETMSIGATPTIDETKTALGITNFTGSLLCFNEPATILYQNQGWQYFDNYPGVPPGFTDLSSGKGYNINLRPGNDILKFKGDLNAGQHIFNISYTIGNYGAGWNLVGNPYPCDYDLNGVAGLGTVVDGMSNTIFYNNNGTYGYWNVLTNTGSSVGYTDILPPMTGFFVVATNSSFTQLVLPVASKSTLPGDSRSQHKGVSSEGDKEQVFKKVKLVLSKETKSDETIVLLADDAAFSYNEHYDAFKLFDENSTSPGIYSEVNGTDYFMKAVACPVSEPVRIPLKVVVSEAGSHEINVTEFENLNDVRVVLKHGDIKTILNKNSSYWFTSGKGTFTDFELIFGDNTRIETADELPLNGTIKTWYNNQNLYINSSTEALSGNCNIRIYDIQGKSVFNDSQTYLVPGQTIQVPVKIPKGIYILNIIANNRSVKTKFVVF